MMGLFSNRHMDRAVEIFADRFEPDGDRYIYFHGAGHGGKAVSADERDHMIEAYRKGLTRMAWSVAIVTILLICIFTILDGWDIDKNVGTWGCIAFAVAAVILVTRKLLQAPLHLVERRPDVRPAKTKADIRREYYAKMPWPQFAAIGIGTILVIGLRAYEANNRMDFYAWGAATLLLMGAVLYGAILKWRS